MGISYGRLGKKEREARFPGSKEQEKKKKNYTTLHEILQSKKCKEVRANKKGVGIKIREYGNPYYIVTGYSSSVYHHW